jgi:hypothetical protein
VAITGWDDWIIARGIILLHEEYEKTEGHEEAGIFYFLVVYYYSRFASQA